jgi:hypothetical protein
MVNHGAYESLEMLVATAAISLQIIRRKTAILILAAVFRASLGITVSPAKILPTLAVRRIELRGAYEVVKGFDVMFLGSPQLPIKQAPVILPRPLLNLAPSYPRIMQPDRTEPKFGPETEVLVIVHVHAEKVCRGLGKT